MLGTLAKGCVGAEPILHILEDQLDPALALEVGKSLTEVPPGRRLPVAPPSAITVPYRVHFVVEP